MPLNQSQRPGSSCEKLAPPIWNTCWKVGMRGRLTVGPTGGERCPRSPDVAIGSHVISVSTPIWAYCSCKFKSENFIIVSIPNCDKTQRMKSLRVGGILHTNDKHRIGLPTCHWLLVTMFLLGVGKTMGYHSSLGRYHSHRPTVLTPCCNLC